MYNRHMLWNAMCLRAKFAVCQNNVYTYDKKLQQNK